MIPLAIRARLLCIVLCVVILLPPASAVLLSPGSSLSSAPAIANGDPVSVHGTATGHPRDGLQVWLIGYNYVKITTVVPDADNTYAYDLRPADTRTLAPGQYFVLIQHPMMNAQFDIVYDPATGEVINRQLGSGMPVFRLGGPGSLQTPDGAGALMRAINSQNTDDTFAIASFVVGSPAAFIRPVGDHVVGDRFTITGSTNLAVGDTLAIEITSSSFKPTQKWEEGGFSGTAGTITVVPGTGGLNQWSFPVDTSAFRPDEYRVLVTGITVDVTGSATFTLTESPPAAVTAAVPSTTVLTVPASPTPLPEPVPSTQKSPLSPAVMISAIAAVSVSGLLRRKNRG